MDMPDGPASATVLADSITTEGVGLTTMLLRYPRFIHPEVLTHRNLSRNSASSRAIPTARRIKMSLYTPERFGRNCKGMASRADLGGVRGWAADKVWRLSVLGCRTAAWALSGLGVHKQWANRPLDWCSYIDVLVTANEAAWWDFIALRDTSEAQPEIRCLAQRISEALAASTPVLRESLYGYPVDTSIWFEDRYAEHWHIPFRSVGVSPSLSQELQVATARCARLSYMTHQGEYSVTDDVRLHDQLKTSHHWSPFEHCAVAVYDYGTKGYRSRNFRGWRQYRSFLDERGI